MSFLNYYEYIPGEYQDVSREPLSAAGPDPAWFLDTNGVKLAGYNAELWDSVSGGVQLLEGTDYSLVYQDAEKSISEGQPIWAGYQVITPIFQDVALYLTIRMIGGYTVYHGDTVTGVIVEDYESNGQRVTKWDTGLMTIGGVDLSGTASILLTFAVPFTSIVTASVSAQSSSSANASFSNLTNQGIEIFSWQNDLPANLWKAWQAIGRWK